MKNFTPQQTLEIMKLVAEIATAKVGKTVQSIEQMDKVVRTLFPTMCELLEKANEED